MNLALANYNKFDGKIFENIEEYYVVVKNKLDLLKRIFLKFDSSKYFKGDVVDQLNTLKLASEFAQKNYDTEKKFMNLVKELKSAYNICCGDKDLFSIKENLIHFYLL